MDKKYELTDETKKVSGAVVNRIRALRDFADVKAGDLGGFIEKEENLSHDGKCWVYDDAEICGNAKVFDDTKVYGEAKVCGNAEIYDNAVVRGDTVVCGNAVVRGNAKINKNADYIVIAPISSRIGYTTFYKMPDGINVCCRCFNGSIDKYEEYVRDINKCILNKDILKKYIETINYVKSVLD